MLDVRRLRILQHLAAHGTVAATAEALRLTPPGVSQHLAALEREAGVAVVEKHGRTLRLTAAGRLLVEHAEVILGDIAAAESDLAALRGGSGGVVRVTAFATAARVLLPPVHEDMARGGKREPRISLQVAEPDRALDDLVKRRTDLAIVHGYTVLPRTFPAGSERDLLTDEPVVLVQSHDAARRAGLRPGDPVELSAFSDAEWLTPGSDTTCYEMIQRACGAAGFVPGITASSSDFSVLTALAAVGAGVALVPRLALPEDTARLSTHPLSQPLRRTLHTVCRSGTAHRPEIRRLLELLRASAARWDARFAEA